MKLILLCLFGAICITIGYCVGSARAEWLHLRTKRLLKDLDKAQSSLEQLQYEIDCALEESGILNESGTNTITEKD